MPVTLSQPWAFSREHKARFLNGQTWFARPGAAGLLFQLTLGRHLSLQKKKEKRKKKPTCRDRCAQSLVRQSCSRNNVVEPVGKTSLVLDTVFWTRPREGVNWTLSVFANLCKKANDQPTLPLIEVNYFLAMLSSSDALYPVKKKREKKLESYHD